MLRRDAARVCACPALLARAAGGLRGRGIPLPASRACSWVLQDRRPACKHAQLFAGIQVWRAVNHVTFVTTRPRPAASGLPRFDTRTSRYVRAGAMDEDRAAAKIAAAKRGKNARKQAAERKEQSKASSTIAAARKGKNARRERKEMIDGAVRIQSQYRGKQSRARCAEMGATRAQRFYTPAEVAKHDRADDLWVSLFGKVLDLSELVQANRGPLVQPLIAAAGTDITHWFDDSTHDLCTHVDPETEIEVPFTPMGRFLHCVPVC